MAQQVNRAAVLHGIGDLRLEDRSVPQPGSGEVRVAMRSVGICGSDVHYWENGRIGDFVVRAPLILGHESAGIVDAVGPDVTTLQPGDRVTLEPGVPCRRCAACKAGRYNLCPDVQFLAYSQATLGRARPRRLVASGYPGHAPGDCRKWRDPA